MEYGNVSFDEFLNNCYKGKIKSKIEMYNFTKIKSNDFERLALEYLIFDIRNYIYKIFIYIRREDEYIGGYFGTGQIKLPTTYDYFTLIDVPKMLELKFTPEQINELTSLKFEDYLTLKDRVEILKSKLTNADFDYIKCESNLPNLLIMSNIVECKYKKIIETSFTGTTIKTPTQPKQRIAFARLFKHPHNQDLEQFKKKLKDIDLIDNNYQWRAVDNNGKRLPIKDIGKFYDWLYSDTTVFDKTADKTTHCICFCGEFGIIAYEGTENKPKTGRTVTAKLIRESTFDSELKNKYNTHFKTWINKEK